MTTTPEAPRYTGDADAPRATTYAVWTKFGLYNAALTEAEVMDVTGCDDIEACIDTDGWCGCWIDVEKAVVVRTDEYEHGLPNAANEYLEH